MKECWTVGIKTTDGKYFSCSGSKQVCEEFVTSVHKMNCYQESLQLEQKANSDKLAEEFSEKKKTRK